MSLRWSDPLNHSGKKITALVAGVPTRIVYRTEHLIREYTEVRFWGQNGMINARETQIFG